MKPRTERRFSLMVVLLAFFVLPWTALAEVPEVRRDVPYVPTPENVVAEMIRLAAVTGKDVLYDLGCGDGRIVVTAAKEKGARGIGVDIDPERIRESRLNAKKAGVTDRVKFIQDDLFTVDFSEATVLSMYLLPDVNLRLRPKILKELRPGTRVVSHDFDMAEWAPDRHIDMEGHDVYFWIVPANASGTWQWKEGKEAVTLRLDQRFQKVTGTLKNGKNTASIEEGTLTGDRLRFVLPKGMDGRSEPLVFEGRVKGNELEGKAGKKAWEAKRMPGTLVALDGD